MIFTIRNTPARLHPWLDELAALHAIYVNVMDLKRRRDQLHGLRRVGAYLYLGYGYLRDIAFNLTTATRIFGDRARELTVTARLKRYRGAVPASTADWERLALAAFLCDQVLDRADPDGDHC